MNHNAKVYIGGRDPKRVAGAIEDLRKETGKEALFLQLDLADLQSIKRAVAEFVRCVAVTRLARWSSHKEAHRALARKAGSTSCSTAAES